ncbi:hypothetical protein IAU59_000927 [Kwoniella sp. CBS 9459]
MIVLEILILLVLLLADSEELTGPGKCTCDCQCGRKYHVPSSYSYGTSTGIGTLATTYQKVRPDRPLYTAGAVEISDRYVGGGIGDASGRLGDRRGNPWDNRSDDSQKSLSENNGYKKDHHAQAYAGRTIPPHLERSAPDWKSPYLTSSGKKKHKQSAQQDEVWCGPCTKKFSSITALHQHQAVIHTVPAISTAKQNQRPYTPDVDNSALVCEVCYEDFPHSSAVRQHKKDAHPWSLFCHDCLITFAHAQDARDHYELVHDSKPINLPRTQRMLDHLQGRSAASITAFGPVSNTAAEASRGLPVSATGPASFPANHVVKTYPTHTVSSHYECPECHMVFGDPGDLAIHQSSPMAHGGANLTSDDFPPLGAAPPSTLVTESSPDLSSSPSSSSPDKSRSPVRRVSQNAWTPNMNMPSFSLKAKMDIRHNGITPEARLTPEPDSTSSSGVSEDDSVDIVLDREERELDDEPMGDESFDTIKDDNTPRMHQEENENDFNGEASITVQTDESDLMPKNKHSVPSSDTNASEDLTSSWSEDRSMKSTASGTPEDVVTPSSTLSSPETPKITKLFISPPAYVKQVETTVPIDDESTASAKAHIDLVPLHARIPYARAALASASRLNVYPPPIEDEDFGSWGKSEEQVEQEEPTGKWEPPEPVGGIDYQLPSFTMGFTSPGKQPTSAPPTLDSSTYTEDELGSGDIFQAATKAGTSMPLTLRSNNDAVEDPDPWAASQEVYEITLAQRRMPAISLDLGAVSNGNRPNTRERHTSLSGSESSSRASRHSEHQRGEGQRQTFLTPAQRAAMPLYNYNNQNKRIKSESSARDSALGSRSTSRSQGRASATATATASASASKTRPRLIEPRFEGEWSIVTPSSSNGAAAGGGSGRGGRVVKDDPWEASRREAEERQRLYREAEAHDEDIYGGW